MLPPGVDPPTAKIAAELLLNDIDDVLDSLYSDDDLPEGDERTGFETMRHHLHQVVKSLDYKILMFQIIKEDYDNQAAIKRLQAQDRQTLSDFQLARRLGGEIPDSSDDEEWFDATASFSETSDFDEEETWNQIKNFCEPDDDSGRCPSVHKVKATTKSELIGPEMIAKCCACMEDVSIEHAVTLPCKPEAHAYCRDCLVDLFTNSLVNTTLFPPGCCKAPIPLDICRAMLPKELIKDFDLKVEELATPNPTYCANATCSKFIRTNEIKADVGTCVFCEGKTCVRCKGSEHDGLCPSDPHVQLLMDMAKRSRWQTCTKCKNLVELEVGCFHMSCRCTHQFCYLCGADWVPRGCTCPQWDEHYLTRPVIDNPAPAVAPVPAPAPAPAAPAPAAPPLHMHIWQREDGANCQACGADYLQFAMRCRGCNIANCWRCIDNLP